MDLSEQGYSLFKRLCKFAEMSELDVKAMDWIEYYWYNAPITLKNIITSVIFYREKNIEAFASKYQKDFLSYLNNVESLSKIDYIEFCDKVAEAIVYNQVKDYFSPIHDMQENIKSICKKFLLIELSNNILWDIKLNQAQIAKIYFN